MYMQFTGLGIGHSDNTAALPVDAIEVEQVADGNNQVLDIEELNEESEGEDTGSDDSETDLDYDHL